MDEEGDQTIATSPLAEIGEELRRRLRGMFEEKWQGRVEPRVEAVKTSLLVHYGPPGHRISMTRAEALRFLDITALSGSEQGGAVAGAGDADA
jgi:hypothetical protein